MGMATSVHIGFMKQAVPSFPVQYQGGHGHGTICRNKRCSIKSEAQFVSVCYNFHSSQEASNTSCELLFP
jgi:hypothetical protein